MDRKIQRKVWDKAYREKHKEELKQKRADYYYEKTLAESQKVLSHLIYDYIAGVQLGELNEKYKVAIRKQRSDTSISVPER